MPDTKLSAEHKGHCNVLLFWENKKNPETNTNAI